ncbi:universal stress protein [Halomarina ordinaria]|uniref:Universal stress protein n=1 Tax=Halomarina ordinaria TaxID=3033939 RepID=A0ABD5UDL0_9EURY|nr:universal stress protein [Halomarina sp. PSRA2]
MYETILVPTDGSAGAGAATDLAVDLARQYDAAVRALFVVDTTALPADAAAAYVDDALEEIGEEATAAVRDRAEAAGVTVAATDIGYGAPHRQILEYAEDNGVDLIVIGTHGRRGIDRLLMGSVAEKVVRLSPVPVLTTRAAEEQAE